MYIFSLFVVFVLGYAVGKLATLHDYNNRNNKGGGGGFAF